MTLHELIERSAFPDNWDNWAKIPWNDPGFSERMLANHLSQDHDWASRTNSIIETQVAFIHGRLPKGAAILDLGCGPGLYTEKLRALGHPCTGVDFSPASINYAGTLPHGKDIEYVLEDIRQYRPKCRFDAVLLLFGEINVFPREEALAILRTAASALRPGGVAFVETHTAEAVREAGMLPSTWQSFAQGLFSENPHLCLEEHFWNETLRAAMARYYIVDAKSASCTEYASYMQAYSEAEYETLFREAGFAAQEEVSGQSWPTGNDFSGKLQCRVYGLA